MKKLIAALVLCTTLSFAAGTSTKKSAPKKADAAAQLRQTEIDFAKAFADRNVERFASFVADDARFTSAGQLRPGKAAIVEQWTKMMQNPNLSLTWSPDLVEVSKDGTLGYTSGPYEVTVKRADGPPATERGRFASVWRRGPDGKYRIILDIGSPEPAH